MSDKKTYTREEAIALSTEYFEGDTLAASVFVDKYALVNEHGELVEATPTEMHRRLAKEFARVDMKYPNPISEEEYFAAMDKFQRIVPQGSPMNGIGNDYQTTSISNCFVIGSPQDSYGGIMKADEELVQLMKRRAGVGLDISHIRPKGLQTKNAAKTTDGIGVFMERFSNSCREVAQLGRRGAELISISIKHPEIETFIKIKNDKTKVTGANISIRISDDFMKAVKEDGEYEQKWPIDSETPTISKMVKAKDIWEKIIHNAWSMAEPGLLFWDTVNKNSPSDAYPEFKSVSTNPCQPDWAKVLTPSGIKTFADVGVGDSIWSQDGWTKIVKKWSTGIKEVYRYGTTAGAFYGTENHRVLSKGIKVEAKDAESIDTLVGEYVQDLVLDPQDIVDGLVIGDGMVHKASNNLVLLCIGANDTDYFSSEISSYIKQQYSGQYSHKVITTITHTELPKTYLREIPKRFLCGDKAKVAGFLRGLFSANGGITGDRVALKASSFKVIEDVQVMLSSLGIRSYYTTNKAKEMQFSNGVYTKKQSYDLNISTDRKKFQSIIGFIQEYKNEKLDFVISKLGPSAKPTKSNYDIVSSELVSEEEVFDITVDNNSHTYWTAGLSVSNCGEINLSEYDSCRLISMNLLSFVKEKYTEKAYFDFEEFKKYSKMAQRMMDNIVDLELEKIESILTKIESDPETDDVKRTERELWIKIKKACENGRRTGLGVTALGDTIAALGVLYGSKESVEVVESLYKALELAAYESSIDMAQERGIFPVYDYELEKDHVFISRVVSNLSKEYQEKYKQYGRRNVALTTTAPAGSVSILTQTSSGIEPVFMLAYDRRKKINPSEEGVSVDYVDTMGDKWQVYKVYHHELKKWMEVTGETDITKSPWYGGTANEIDWVTSVDMQAAAQRWVDHSISKTCNLPENVTEQTVADVYMRAWETGCKGFTVYRDKCRDGVLVTSSEPAKKVELFEEKDAPKRPEIMYCEIFQVKISGDSWTIFIGLFEGKPFEIFGGLSKYLTLSKKITSGKIQRHPKKKGQTRAVYDLHCGDEKEPTIVKDIVKVFENATQSEFTRILSLALRHGSPLKYVVDQLQKDEESDMYSFSKVIARVLKNYIKDGTKVTGKVCSSCGSKELIYQEGCSVCLSCGGSKCN